jgi:tRNA A-37 threonylcarbamoyl transferase component Bud32
VIGTLLNDRFRLEEKIGSGGMSTVYRAFDEVLERSVAIKIMHREISDDPDQLERFRREARAVARLNNPYVVTVIDAGEDEGYPFIVFEYVAGETLKERIKRVGRLPAGEAIAYAIEIGRALAAAHNERLIHRDVKPQNVLIDSEGRPKVTDFGIARSLETEGLTATGRVLGTTDYVAPEQAMGEAATEQSDVYALGVCLYEMLTGEVPFKADTQVGVAMKHVRDPLPDVRAIRPELSAATGAIVERATAKEPEHRYATVDEMLADLEHALAVEAARSGETTGEATSVLQALPGDTADFVPLRLRRPRRALLLTLLLGLAIAATVVVLVSRTEQGTKGGAAPAQVPEPEQVRLTSAGDFDPAPGDQREHENATRSATDGNRATFWDTERYEQGALNKPGVGLYVETASPVAARGVRLVSPEPGFTAEVYGANSVPEALSGWTKVGGPKEVGETANIPIDTRGRRYRYYLVWITKLGQGQEQAAISELTLEG